MSSVSVRVLVTGAGAPGIRGTLYALRNNPERRRVHIVGIDVQPDVVGRYLVDHFCTVPAPEDPEYIDRLRAICQEQHVRVVLPQTTREIEKLSACKDLLERDSIAVMVSDRSAIDTANNKWALVNAFRHLDLPAPAVRLASDETALLAAVEELGYPRVPVVVKPPISNGMRGVRVLKENSWDVTRFLAEKPDGLCISLRDLLCILRRGPGWPELLVMEYLPGPEYTVDAFASGPLSVAVPRLRKAIRSGITFISETAFRQDLIDYTLRAAEYLRLTYAFGFQFKVDVSGVPKVLECNPRIQGTMVASVFAGANVIWWGVKAVLGEPLPEKPQLRPARFLRYWGGVGLAEGVVDEI